MALQSAPVQSVKDAGWIMDSGASDHMCCRRDWLITYEAFDHEGLVCIGDGGHIEALGKGCINVDMFNRETWNENYLVDVLYVPKLKYNLFSAGATLDKGLKMQSTSTTCELSKNGRIIATGIRQGKLFAMQFEVEEPPWSIWKKDPPQAYVSSMDTL